MENLSLELLLLIQQSLDSPLDLHHLTAASPVNFRVFQQYSQHVLSAVLQNAIHPVSMPTAMALLQVPSADPGHVSLHPRMLDPFLDNYFSGEYNKPPGDKASLAGLQRLYTRVSYLSEDFAARAWREVLATDIHTSNSQVESDHVSHNMTSHLDKAHGPSKGSQYAVNLSSDEKGRLFRAFFRFELYCKVFSDQGIAPMEDGEPFITARQQRDYFLMKLRPFEVEELACVHQYYSTVVGDFVGHLEDDFVNEILTAAKAQVNPAAFTSHRRRRSVSPFSGSTITAGSSSYGSRDDAFAHTKRESPCPDSRTQVPGNEMVERESSAAAGMKWVRAGDLDVYDLDLFSSDAKRRFDGYITYMVSQGIDFVYDLMRAGEVERRKMILDNSPALRIFLPEAMRTIPHQPISNSHDEDSSDNNPRVGGSADHVEYTDDDPIHPNRGWAKLRLGGNDYIRDGLSFAPLRARGWVFWDAKRMGFPTIGQKLLEVRHMDHRRLDALYDRSQRTSGEERLAGVMLPATERDRIYQKYSSTFDQGLDGEEDGSEDDESDADPDEDT